MSSLKTITYLIFIKKLFTKYFLVLVHPNNSPSTYNVPDTVLTYCRLWLKVHCYVEKSDIQASDYNTGQ